MTRIVGVLSGHPNSSPGWAGLVDTPHAVGLIESFGSDGACFRTVHGIFTAAHLLADQDTPWCTVNDAESQVIQMRRELDIAIVSTPPGCDLPVLPLATELPRVGAPVTWYGLDNDWHEESHKVTVTLSTRSRIEVSWAPGKMGPGDSGAPVLDEHGAVIGMMVGEIRYRSEGRSLWRAVLVPSTVLLDCWPSAEKGRLFEP